MDISADILKESVEHFKAIVGEAYVFTDAETLAICAKDETEDLHFLPHIVIKPKTAEEVSAILKICNNAKIPVTARGAGTGLAGGALPHRGGVVLHMHRFNNIIHIDEQNLQVIVEPGVITEELQNAVKEKGLFYPPDPASKGSCFIGGNISHNSGGPKAVKYGVVKDYVLNLQVVLANGEIIWTGKNILKNSTGYNLTQLMVGSEGTLGIVTQIVLKLLPLPKHDLLMLVPFKNLEKAGEAVSHIFRAGFVPSAMELMEIESLKIVCNYVDSNTIPLTDDTEAHLIIEVDGNDVDVLMQQMEQITILLEEYPIGEIYFADDAAQKAQLWQLRRKVAEAVKLVGYSIEEDTVVPRANLPKLIRAVKEIGEKYDFKAVAYGHAGDGNLHIRIKKEGVLNSNEDPNLILGIRALFEEVNKLGGTISGEHGIGMLQKQYMDIVMQPIHFELMKGIKKTFDPNNILNPGKVFDI
jgi:glycolate oxidase